MLKIDHQSAVGYVRALSAGSTLDSDIEALIDLGIPKKQIFTDHADNKPLQNAQGFCSCLEALRTETALVVCRLSQLGRTLSELTHTVDAVRRRGARLVSLDEKIDTDTPSGKLMFEMIGTFAAAERDMISERRRSGLKAAKHAGRTIGRKPILVPGNETWQSVVNLMRQGHSPAQIASMIDGISKSTLYNHLNELRAAAAYLE